MISPWRTRLTGGCQCGAVRYELMEPPVRACICHCRMCQKASGQPFMAFATVKQEHLNWTRGTPGVFQSSNVAQRGFCKDCGTPLTFKFEGDEINVTTGSLDDPTAAPPTVQYGVESAIAWCADARRSAAHQDRGRFQSGADVARLRELSASRPRTNRESAHRTSISPAVATTRITTVVPVTVATCRQPSAAMAGSEVPSPSAPIAISRPQVEASTSGALISAIRRR